MDDLHATNFKASEVVIAAWKTVRGSLGVYSLLALSLILTLVVFSFIEFPKEQRLLTLLSEVVSFVIIMGIMLGYYAVSQEIVQGKKPKIADAFLQFDPILLIKYFIIQTIEKLIIVIMLIPVIIILGFIVWGLDILLSDNSMFGSQVYFPFLITGQALSYIMAIYTALLIPFYLFISLRLVFSRFIILDKKTGAVTALRQSWRITKRNNIQLLLLALYLIGINILGALALFIGLFVTIPLSFLAFAYTYRKLTTK